MGLGAMGYAEAVPSLMEFLGNEDERLSEAAKNAILDIGPDAIPLLEPKGDWMTGIRRAVHKRFASMKETLIDELIANLSAEVKLRADEREAESIDTAL